MLRYASVLVEETTNIEKAETVLSKGISLCEKVSFEFQSIPKGLS